MADLSMTRGDDVTLTITARDATGALINLTGKILWLRASRVSGEIVFTKRTGAGIANLTQSGPTLGQATVTVDAADTAALPSMTLTLDYESQLEDSGKENTIDRGTLTVRPDRIVGAPA